MTGYFLGTDDKWQVVAPPMQPLPCSEFVEEDEDEESPTGESDDVQCLGSQKNTGAEVPETSPPIASIATKRLHTLSPGGMYVLLKKFNNS